MLGCLFPTHSTALAANSAVAPSAQLPRISGNYRHLNISANTPEPRTPPPSAWSHCSPLQLSAQQRTINLRSRLQSLPRAHPASPTQHPTPHSAQPARAGVRSESPHPAERTNKKTAGSTGIDSFNNRPPLLQHQVRSRAPPSPSTSPRGRPRAHTRAPDHHQHIHP